MDQPLKQWLTGRKRGEDKNKKLKHLENEKSFLDEIKIFKGLSFGEALRFLKIDVLLFKSTSLTSFWFLLLKVQSCKLLTVKPVNSEHLLVLKIFSVIERCRLLGGNFKKIVTFGTKRFVLYSWRVPYLGCPLLGGFTVITNIWWLQHK